MNVKINLKTQQIKIISYLGVVLIFSAAAFFSWGFLYKNFFLVITQSTEILNAQNAPIETIDLEKFDQVIKKIDNKTTTREDFANTIKNPFD
jgi:hypothetical protein